MAATNWVPPDSWVASTHSPLDQSDDAVPSPQRQGVSQATSVVQSAGLLGAVPYQGWKAVSLYGDQFKLRVDGQCFDPDSFLIYRVYSDFLALFMPTDVQLEY